MPQKGYSAIYLILIILIVISLSMGSYWFFKYFEINGSFPFLHRINILIETDNDITSETPLLEPLPLVYTFGRDGSIWFGQGFDNNFKVLTDYKFNNNPVLSHDSKKVAYLRTDPEVYRQMEEIAEAGGHLGGFGPGFEVWIVNSDGSNLRKLTDASIAYPPIKFSPNDKYISFITPLENRLVVINLEDGKEVINLKLKNNTSADKDHVWNNDSQTILVAEDITEVRGEYAGVKISKISILTGQITMISSIPLTKENYSKFIYRLSPDLKRIAYFTEVQKVISWGISKYDWGYFISDIDGKNVNELLIKKDANTYHGPNIYFNWSPNSKLLAFYNEEASGIPTKLQAYDFVNNKLINVIESEPSELVWDRNDNLYFKRFVRNIGYENSFSKYDFIIGKYEKFIDNIDELNFGD